MTGINFNLKVQYLANTVDERNLWSCVITLGAVLIRISRLLIYIVFGTFSGGSFSLLPYLLSLYSTIYKGGTLFIKI